MLVYSTLLDVVETLTKEEFIKLAIEWMQGSPYQDSIIPNIQWNGEMNIRYGNNALWMQIEEYRNKNIIAIRYEKAEKDGVIWDTDFVLNFSYMRLAIRLDRSFMPFFQSFDSAFSIPYFVSLLINKKLLKDDGLLPITREPFVIEKNNIGILVDIICGRVSYNLPVVYVSKTKYDQYPVSVGKLANQLRGIAHVLVQQDGWTNYDIRRLCESKNEYYGAIGIYYPLAPAKHTRFLYDEIHPNGDMLAEKTIHEIFSYSNSKEIPTLYTWNGVTSSLLTDRLKSQIKERQDAEKAQKQAQDEKEQYIDAFDEDLEKYKRQIENLAKQNEALMIENQGLRTKLDEMDKVPALLLGNEKDYYAGEIKEHLLSVLSDALTNIEQNTRHFDIIQDIISNNYFEKKRTEKANDIKRLFCGYNKMTSELRQELEAMGINIHEDGKHYKLTLLSDNRYIVTIAKTPSDNRAGKNCASIIVKKMF